MSRDTNMLLIAASLLLCSVSVMQPLPVPVAVWHSMGVRLLCFVGQGIVIGIYVGRFVWKR